MSDRADETENNYTLLRVLLALMVVLGHFKLLSGTPYPSFPFNLADAAVDSFFVVSGFLITLSYGRCHGVWSFYVRRGFRLYPLYACVVLFQTGIMLTLLPGGPLSEPQPTIRYLAANVLLANFLQYDIGGVLSGLHVPGINPSLWTLKIEIGFYLLVPMIFSATRRWGWPMLAAIYVASVGYNVLMLWRHDEQLARQLPGQLQFFVVGMALCLYGRRLRVHPLATVAITVGFLLAWSLVSIPPGVRPLVVAAFVYSFAMCRWAVPLNSDMSYGVYLVHGPLLQTSILLGLFRGSLEFLAALLCVVFALSYLVERVIERPGNSLGRSLSIRVARRGPAVAGAT